MLPYLNFDQTSLFLGRHHSKSTEGRFTTLLSPNIVLFKKGLWVKEFAWHHNAYSITYIFVPIFQDSVHYFQITMDINEASSVIQFILYESPKSLFYPFQELVKFSCLNWPILVSIIITRCKGVSTSLLL